MARAPPRGLVPSCPAHEGVDELGLGALRGLLKHLLHLRGAGSLHLVLHADAGVDLLLIHFHYHAVVDDLVQEEHHVREEVHHQLPRRPVREQARGRGPDHRGPDALHDLDHHELVLVGRRDDADDDVVGGLEQDCVVIHDRHIGLALGCLLGLRQLAGHALLEGRLLLDVGPQLLACLRVLHREALALWVYDQDAQDLAEASVRHALGPPAVARGGGAGCARGAPLGAPAA
mmetsp:Transcript_36811/g.114419  ORF Transcript_36811/g.114419 Transcript_36811/m.114419 type:complete len:232 (-) Transcript_36811:6-701(-)